MIKNLLYKRVIPINDNIRIRIPLVGEILSGDNEEKYFSLVYSLTATPTDMMVQLDDLGVDYSQISDYDLFLILFDYVKTQDLSLIFDNLDLSAFEKVVNLENNLIVLRDPNTGIVIDLGIYNQICSVLRDLHHLKRNVRKPGNDEAKKFLIERARRKLQRESHKTHSSQLEDLIVSLVNTEQFPYDFEGVKNLTIYQLNESLRQVMNKISFDNRMRGIYAGTIDADKLPQGELTWLRRDTIQ